MKTDSRFGIGALNLALTHKVFAAHIVCRLPQWYTEKKTDSRLDIRDPNLALLESHKSLRCDFVSLYCLNYINSYMVNLDEG